MHIPVDPGVFQFFNSKKDIIYIGKAKNLRKELVIFRTKRNVSKNITMVKHICKSKSGL